MGHWDNFYYNCENEDDNPDFDDFADEILEKCETGKLLAQFSDLDPQKCCSRLFHKLLCDPGDIVRKRNLIIKKAKNVLEKYVENLRQQR